MKLVSGIGMLKSQTAVNLMAAVGTFAVGVLIRFFMTPYIVRHLGVEAYGFVGLSANILGLTSLLTIALNSLAGRFITIAYQSGDKEGANSYYSSLLIANCILGVILGVLCGVLCWRLDSIIQIPPGLIPEVKLLFAVLSLNSILVLVSGIWSVGAFIRNRIEVVNGIVLGGNLVNALSLIALFGLGVAHIWYVGVAVFMMGIFIAACNFLSMSRLTPDIKFSSKSFNGARVIELLKNGSWNLISRLGELLGQGVDLFVANLFIGAAMTGVLAITKNIPFVLLGMFSAIAAAFGPMLVRRYAEGRHSQFMAVLDRSVKTSGLFAAPLFACLFVFGYDFYKLWMPEQDALLLQILTLLGTANMVFAMPLEVLWTVFTTVNKLKWPTLFMLGNNILVFATMIGGCFLVERMEYKLFVIAGARSMWGIIRSFTFLPIYGAAAVCVPKTTFYVSITKSVVMFAASTIVAIIVKRMLCVSSWGGLCSACLLVSLSALVVGSAFVLWRNIRKHMPMLRRKRPMMHFVYRKDMFNAGDLASCPVRYFKWPMPVKVHDINDVDLRWFCASDVVVFGGGGLFDCDERWNRTINEILEKCENVFAWSVGFNTHKGNVPQEKIDFGKFSLLTIRDRDHPSGFEWLPCVSCMAVEESLCDISGSGIGVVSHHDHLIRDDSGSDVILNSETPDRIFDFIRKHDSVVTNSYHAAYWAGLLNRKVVLRDTEYSDKFNWLSSVDLDIAKKMNYSFYRRIIASITK